MHRTVTISFLGASIFLARPVGSMAQSANPAHGAPLPDAKALLERALANEKKLAAERERYECRVTTQAIETDSKGQTKKDTTEVSDLFYVNGIPIERLLEKNGKDLSADEEHKQDDRVMKETVKYSNQANAEKEENKEDQELEDFMQAMMLANGRREMLNGHSVLFYDIVPNPKFQARNLDQRFARVMQGTVSIEEETGEVIDFNVKSVQDLKIGGGVLADLHKGFWLHLHNQPQGDGVWLTDLAEGSGDARAAIFFHPYFRFRQTTNNCHLYTTAAAQVGPAEPVKKP